MPPENAELLSIDRITHTGARDHGPVRIERANTAALDGTVAQLRRLHARRSGELAATTEPLQPRAAMSGSADRSAA